MKAIPLKRLPVMLGLDVNRHVEQFAWSLCVITAIVAVAVVVLTGCKGSSYCSARDGGLDADAEHDAGEELVDGGDGGKEEFPQPDPECVENGCLRFIDKVGDFSKEYLSGYLEDGVDIDNGYSVFYLVYYTGGRESSGVVTIPFEAEPPAEGYAIVANAHGTTGVGDACRPSAGVLGAGLAGAFGARGFIGVATDYPGLGTEGTHPYLVGESAGKAVLDSLRAARQSAGLSGVSFSDRYAVAGLSQGGHASLFAAALHGEYAPDLDIRGFAAAGPAMVWHEHWSAGASIDGPHLVYHALAIWAWSKHYGYSGPPVFGDAPAPFMDDYMENRCVYDVNGEDTLSPVIPEVLDELFSEAFAEAYLTGEWGEYELFGQAFESNRVGPYEQTAPLVIYQGALDFVTPESHTSDGVAALRNSGLEVEYVIVAEGSHTDIAFGPVAYLQLKTDESIEWIRARVSED